jgi:hypothetical protein
VEHRAPVKLLRLLWFANALTSLQVFPISVISSSVGLLQVFLGRPLLLAPWGFQSNASFFMAPAGFLKVCPVHFHFFLIWMSIDSCFVISHRELFDIVSGHLMFKMRLKHLFTKELCLFAYIAEFFIQFSALQCVTPEIASLMRVIIILCFMAMICSLVGFFLDIVGPTKKIMKLIQRNSLPSIFTGK